MLRLILSALILLSFTFNAFAAAKEESTHARVIYVTLDGVRWQDVFTDHRYFPRLWQKYAKAGTFYGAPGSDTRIEVASVPISMPSYQSQMSGSIQPCTGNGCGRILVETVAENLVHTLGLDRKDVATFASWAPISLAVEHTYGTTYANTGKLPVYDPLTGRADSTMVELNQKQFLDPTDETYRHDKFTFAQALHYLKTFQPRFLWIAMGDADSYAHEGNILNYHLALATYDEMLDTLFSTLKELNLDKDTLVIVTTDHGRGDGIHWTDHGPNYPESKRTWAFVMNGTLVPTQSDGKSFSTLSIRPTIERAFKIKS